MTAQRRIAVSRITSVISTMTFVCSAASAVLTAEIDVRINDGVRLAVPLFGILTEVRITTIEGKRAIAFRQNGVAVGIDTVGSGATALTAVVQTLRTCFARVIAVDFVVQHLRVAIIAQYHVVLRFIRGSILLALFRPRLLS